MKNYSVNLLKKILEIQYSMIYFRWIAATAPRGYFNDLFLWNICKSEWLYNSTDNLVNKSKFWDIYYFHRSTLF